MLPDETEHSSHHMFKNKNRNYKNTTRNDGNIISIEGTVREKIVKAIIDSINGAREVAQREHIKADRIERVQHFCTFLRRHLGYELDIAYKSVIINEMDQKALWFDIGQLNGSESVNPKGWRSKFMSISDVHELVSEAKLTTDFLSTTSLANSIERDILSLNDSFVVVDKVCEEAHKVNDEGKIIIAKMVELAESMEG